MPPILAADEACVLLDSIDISTLVGLRDRGLMGLMAYTFARGRGSTREIGQHYPSVP